MKVYLIQLQFSDSFLISSRYCKFVSLSVYMSSRVCLRVCVFVGGEVVLSDKGVRLEPPGFIWAKQEGPRVCLGSGASEPRTEGASSQLTPELLPAWDQPLSLSIALSIHRASSLSFFHYPLYPRHFSPRPWPGLLLPLPLWTLWCRLCWPFPQIMCMFGNGPFAQTSVCLWIYISQTGYAVNGLQRETFSLMY